MLYLSLCFYSHSLSPLFYILISLLCKFLSVSCYWKLITVTFKSNCFKKVHMSENEKFTFFNDDRRH